jgi:hypothetical protein
MGLFIFHLLPCLITEEDRFASTKDDDSSLVVKINTPQQHR